MSDEKLEVMAWAELLTNKMAIRSSIRLNSGSSIFSTELIFGDRDTGIFRLKCKRVLGESIERPTTKLEKLNSSLGALLLELRYEWPTDNDKNDRIVDLCLK